MGVARGRLVSDRLQGRRRAGPPFVDPGAGAPDLGCCAELRGVCLVLSWLGP